MSKFEWISMKPKILSFAPIPASLLRQMILSVPGVSQIPEFDVVVINELDMERILKEVEDADVVIGDYTFRIPVTEEMMKRMKKVRLIQQPSTGYDHIDVDAAKKLGIPVANAGSVNALSVAEHTVMVALALLKRLIYSHQRTSEGVWAQEEMFSLGIYELYGKTWGILGMGRQGREVAKRLAGWGVRMVYYSRRRVREVEERYDAEFKSLEEVLREADVVSIHLPLTPETEKLIGEEELRMMKSNAILINVARGGIVDEEALAKALKEGWIGGAAVDVYSEEPVRRDHPLVRLGADQVNLILTPHIAGATNEARLRILNEALSNVVRVLKGEEARNVVNM
jgi:glyoxylate reductase